jgi:hypothetical protein
MTKEMKKNKLLSQWWLQAGQIGMLTRNRKTAGNNSKGPRCIRLVIHIGNKANVTPVINNNVRAVYKLIPKSLKKKAFQ